MYVCCMANVVTAPLYGLGRTWSVSESEAVGPLYRSMLKFTHGIAFAVRVARDRRLWRLGTCSRCMREFSGLYNPPLLCSVLSFPFFHLFSSTLLLLRTQPSCLLTPTHPYQPIRTYNSTTYNKTTQQDRTSTTTCSSGHLAVLSTPSLTRIAFR